MNEKYIATLDDFALLQVSGGRAADFLQGQLTCDVRLLQSGQAVLGACCDHKGRMLFNGWVGRCAEEFVLLVPQNMLAAALAHLQKFAVFSKVTLSEKTDWAALNYYGESLPALSVSASIQAQLPGSHGLWGPAESIAIIQRELLRQAALVTHAQRDYFTLSARLVYIQPATKELFIPQMIGLEQLGGVSFTKGCYVGQEVVARTQHLGQLKRHLQLLQVDSGQAPEPGEILVDVHNEQIGQIAAVSPDPHHGGYRFLAVIQDRALPHPFFTIRTEKIKSIL